MPKKPPKNAFSIFMGDFREEQRKKGIYYANNREVSEAASPIWNDVSPSVRAKYEARAKSEKEKNNVPEKKYTSTGISYAEIEQQARELQDAIEYEARDIKNMVSLRALDNTADTMNIYVMDVNFYCKASVDYVIGESTLLRFNIRDGVKDSYHELINPGSIPIGYASDMKLGSQEFGLNMPDDSARRTNYMQILANIIDYLKQEDHTAKVLPAIYTMPDKVAPVVNFIQQMCRRAGEDETLFRVYQLDTLFFNLINAFKSSPDEGFPKVSLALLQLKKDPFKYTPGIGCELHEENDKSVECSLSRAKRWAYTALDACCPLAGVPAQPGRHMPADFDLESIQVFQEQRRGRLAPSVAGHSAWASCNTSTVSDSFHDSSVDTSDSRRSERRVHVPLRMPRSDYAESVRAPPELSAAEFPSLPVRGAGRGRGMGSSTFSQLSLDD